MGSNKKMCGDDDVMSQLPDSIIGHILGFLPVRNAVRTTVLSREWRLKYMEISKIKYTVRRERTLLGILGLLEAHRGPIHNFSLFVYNLNRRSFSTYDNMLKLVSEKRVRKFGLMIDYRGSLGPKYKLGSSFFSCSELSLLALRECVLKPPPEFKGFAKLVSLVLNEVDITAQLLSTLISQAPLLERAELAICPTFNDALEVTAPNLNFFRLQVHSKSLISVSAPRVNHLILRLPYLRYSVEEHEHDSPVLQLKCAGATESLHLDYYYIKSMHMSGGSGWNLTVLRLSEICFGITHEVKCVLDLMEACPSLEKLTIEAFHAQQDVDVDVDDDAVALAYEALDLSCSRISKVHMLDMNESKNELAFVKTMLLKLTQLETMVIAPDICKPQVSQFRCTSPLAAIKFMTDSKACKESLNLKTWPYFHRQLKI